ncbi:alpha/beta hydrolase-fold protein [Rapidithrix thailandica]|uniref:Alpha/beta hydrolase-fold protein n=1 Tax=Rapidithrix thailandica TaxID=413964 RepID=A0AAW9SH07_9BACT
MKIFSANISQIGLLFSLIVFLSGCHEEDFSDIDRYKLSHITSTYTATKYTIHIRYPENFDTSKAYHILYLLDGNAYFREVSDLIESLQATDVVVIGIDYVNQNKRERDFSFPRDPNYSSSGGANQFVLFLKDELLPYIENQLHIQTREATLFGHSLGGYFSMYMMLQPTTGTPFDHIICASPSLWWADGYIFDMEEQYHLSHGSLKVSLYMSMGDLEGVTMNTFFQAFTRKLGSRNYKDFSFDFEQLKNISHKNSPIVSFEKGFSFIRKK